MINYNVDHLYCHTADNNSSYIRQNTNSTDMVTLLKENKQLKAMLLLHLDLIQEQSDQLTLKDKQLINLKKENEMLKVKLDAAGKVNNQTIQDSGNNRTQDKFTIETNQRERCSSGALAPSSGSLTFGNVNSTPAQPMAKGDTPSISDKFNCDVSKDTRVSVNSIEPTSTIECNGKQSSPHNANVPRFHLTGGKIVLKNVNNGDNLKKYMQQILDLQKDHIVTNIKFSAAEGAGKQNVIPALRSFTPTKISRISDGVKPNSANLVVTDSSKQPTIATTIEPNSTLQSDPSLITESKPPPLKLIIKEPKSQPSTALPGDIENTSTLHVPLSPESQPSSPIQLKQRRSSRNSFLTTTDLYKTREWETVDLHSAIEAGIEDESIQSLSEDVNLEVPSWTVKECHGLYTIEGTEDMSDDAFLKRHARLENDEKRRKKWDVQRIREQRTIERLRRRHCKDEFAENEQRDPDAEIISLFPLAEELKFIEICDQVPVQAFGDGVPGYGEIEYYLPWMNRFEINKHTASTTESTGQSSVQCETYFTFTKKRGKRTHFISTSSNSRSQLTTISVPVTPSTVPISNTAHSSTSNSTQPQVKRKIAKRRDR